MTKEQFTRQLAEHYPGVEVLDIATVLYEGWELDNYVALVRLAPQAQPTLIGTDHGVSFCEISPELLRSLRNDMRQAIESCERVLRAAHLENGSADE